VASIKRFSCLASSLSRFIGAELGVTIATIRPATTVFPNPMFRRVLSILSSGFIIELINLLDFVDPTLALSQMLTSSWTARSGPGQNPTNPSNSTHRSYD
jgi:hypothetical protein